MYPRPPPTHAPHPTLQAIRIDEAAPGAVTSSMSDDVFFVLLKAGRRAMGTCKAPSVVAILNQVGAAHCMTGGGTPVAGRRHLTARLCACRHPSLPPIWARCAPSWLPV